MDHASIADDEAGDVPAVSEAYQGPADETDAKEAAAAEDIPPAEESVVVEDHCIPDVGSGRR